RKRRRPGAHPARRPHPLSLPLAGAAAGQDPALRKDDGRARVRARQARVLDQAGAVPGVALLARLRTARRLPRRLARPGLRLRARQLRAAEGDHAVAAAARTAGGRSAARMTPLSLRKEGVGWRARAAL